MNIAIMAHDNRKELMLQFCTAYLGTLSKHHLCSTLATGAYVSQQTGLKIETVLHGVSGGHEQIGARIDLNEIDLVLLFLDPQASDYGKLMSYFSQKCDRNTIPLATNSGSAEALLLALGRGDLDWREVMKSKVKPQTSTEQRATVNKAQTQIGYFAIRFQRQRAVAR